VIADEGYLLNLRRFTHNQIRIRFDGGRAFCLHGSHYGHRGERRMRWHKSLMCGRSGAPG
jgi:hypothetical protein